MKNQIWFGIYTYMLIVGLAQAVDNSGRNSHFWITLRPQAGTASGSDTDLVLANGYRSVNLGSSDLSCTRVNKGSNWVYQITWSGNSFFGDGGAETLQFNAVVDFNGAVYTMENVTVGGANLSANGLVLQDSDSHFADESLRLNFIVRNPALTVEDPDHAFSDLPDGHTYGPTPYKPTTQAKLDNAFPKFSWDRVPRTMLIRKESPFTAEQYERVAKRYDFVVLEKANGGMSGYWEKATSLKKYNPDIKVVYYWNSRIYFGHNGVDDSIIEKWDEYIDPDFVIRGSLPTYQRENPDLVDWWVGVCRKMMGLVEGYAADGVTPFQDFENWAHGSPIDGYFIDKIGVPISMLKPLYEGTPDYKFGMNNNGPDRNRIPYLDGTYREGWSGGPVEIAKAIALAQESGRNQKLTMLRNPVHDATGKRNVEDRVDENLAIYLTYAEKYAYFYWAPTVDASEADWKWITDYVDQFNRPLGKPLGDVIKDNWIYTRSFEHCDVFLNLKTDSGGKVSRILWKNDIGSPALDGSGFSKTDDTYTLQGSGHISGTSDKFFYLSDLHYGNGQVVARVDSLDNTHADARAGVMFRARNEPVTTELDFAEDYTAAYRNGTVLLPEARTVAVLRDPAGHMHMVYRAATNGAMLSAGTVDPAYGPNAKLVRSGDTFTGYCSPDGQTWTKISQVAMSMDEKVEMGMAVCSGDPAALAEATFSAFSRVESPPVADSKTMNAAKNLYVDANRGNDSNPGTLDKPLKTIQRAAEVMASGDVCYIREGVYRETVTPTKDGLTFKNYEDEYVLITGLDIINGWKSYKNGIMQAPSNTKITQVFVDGRRMNWARYPNEDGDMLSTDELDLVNIKTEKPTGLVTFTRMESKPDDYWVGAYFIGLPTTRNWWTAHRGKVESSTGKTITCTELSALWKNPALQFTGDGAGYIIGHLNALDTLGEWVWQDNTVYLYPPESTDVKTSLIEGRTRIHGFNLTDKNNIILEGLNFKAADIHMPKSDHCTISKCTVRYGGTFSTFFAGGTSQREAWGDFENGASCIFVGGDYNVVKDCYVGRTWTHGISLWGNHNLLENSIAEQCNWQGERLTPIWSPGDDNTIIHNTSRYSGRDGIELGNGSFGIKAAHRALVQFNHVHNVGYLVPDAGLIYCNQQGASPLANTEISYNIVHDFVSTHPGAVGIYLDNSSSGYKVHHNVIWNAHDGIRTRTATENYFINNTIMDVDLAIAVRGSERAGAVIVTQNNLVISDENLYGITKSNNQVAVLNEFTDAAGRDYSLKPGASAIDAGIHVKGITEGAVGLPDLGAFEYDGKDWKAGSTIEVPDFPDERMQ